MKKYILLLFLGMTFTLNAQDIKIDVPIAPQAYSTWCAVAASQCVLRYFGPYVKQCTIMEYVRKETLSYGIYDCCDEEHINQGCNAGGIDLYGGKGTVQAILSYFSNINSTGTMNLLGLTEIRAYLRNDRPLIISLKNKDNGAQHAVVVYGTDVGIGRDSIYYMDPDPDPNFGGYRRETYFKLTTGFNIPFYWYNTLVIGDALYPQHCFNDVCDGDEIDIDCGGSCQPCYTPPPPPNTCANCKKDPGEVGIDCGGPCPPCEDVPEEKIIDNEIYNYSTEVMAFKKITAGKYGVRVKSGANVSFITEGMGSIVLVPGFTAEKGSYFSTQRKDLSEYSRICPEKLCDIAWFLNSLKRGQPLRIYDLLYAVKIVYEIYDLQGRFIYGDALNVTRNGDFVLWDCETGAIVTQGTVTYRIFCTVTYCNGTKKGYLHTFTVTDGSKSLNEESEETENIDTYQSSSFNSLMIPDEITSPTFSILPNPNSGTFQLETNIPLSDIATLKITNMLGATVYETQHLSSHTIQLPASASGQYLVVIVLKDGRVLAEKMIIQR